MNAGEILNSTYEIREKIGEGGGGTIYKAYHKRLQKDVVLKKIHKSGSRNEDEKEILKNLKHSYLPQVYDFLDVEDGVFTIIDYIPGESFEKLLRERRKFSQKQVVKYAVQLCEVVDYLHKQKPPIIHGDIKPANIMLTPQDNICLIDFNISGILEGKSMETVGYTPGYASPEQVAAFIAVNSARQAAGNHQSAVRQADAQTVTLLAEEADETGLEATRTMTVSDEKVIEYQKEAEKSAQGDGEKKGAMAEAVKVEENSIPCIVDARSDIYSIAATLYHFLTGVKPDSDPDKIMPPIRLDGTVGESISIILMKALQKDPQMRFQTAESMLQAFQKIHKYDNRYKRMLLKQELIFLAAVGCIGAGILLTFFGSQQIGEEKESAYVQAVALLSDAVAAGVDGANADVEALYAAAQQMKPERLEAYLQKALYLYDEKQYEEDMAFIEENILCNSSFVDQEIMADVYFIMGNCCFELEQYENAVVYYRTALGRDARNPEYYRDYVISLVRQQKIAEAQAALEEAEKSGVSSVELCLMNGEIKKARQDYEGAEQELMRCIAETEDDYLRMRAYVICDMAYREQEAKLGDGGTEDQRIEYLLKSKSLLEEARTRVGLENQLLIFERLAQTYIDLEDRTSDASYGEKAISVLQDIISHGWGTYVTYNNISILYQKMGQIHEAENTLLQMLDLNPENYNTYKRLAFLEVDRQNQKKNADRAYGDFVSYYEKAKEHYVEASVAGGDTEMQLLDNLYQQLVEGGWLK